MAQAVTNGTDVRSDDAATGARRRLDELRGEIDKYRVVFDSARMIVGHEFIKPLTAINGYVELIEEDLAAGNVDRQGRYFEKIKESVRHIEDLVDAFVQMLRFDSSVERARGLERTDLGRLVDAVRGRFEDDAHRIVNAVDGDLRDLYLRRSCIEVVLDNLVSNAVKNSADHTRITVGATLGRERRGASDAYLLTMSVEDCGVGIPEDEIEDIFNPFYRVGGASDTCGLGLGLALVKSVITIMGGEIHVRSAPDEGTTVTFSVPVSDDRQARNGMVG